MAAPFPQLDPSPASPLSISPTDVSQFIRLDQCQRYLRLRLHQRRLGSRFLTEFDVAPQSIPPILSRAGHEYESRVEAAIASRYPSTHFSHAEAGANDNDAVIATIRDLEPGEVRILFQPRIEARLGAWQIRGDVDLMRLERDRDGTLRILIADIKSSTAAKVEHRLQVAFYHRMLGVILAEQGIAHDPIAIAVLYRGPAMPPTTPEAVKLHEQQLAATTALFGEDLGLLEVIEDLVAYTDAVNDLVARPGSTAERAATEPFERIPFHLTVKCDGCLFNEFCMKQVAVADDLSLIPHLTDGDKSALIRNGVATTTDLASLKEMHQKGTVEIDGETHPNIRLVTAPEKQDLVRRVSTTWPVGPRLDELIHRARRYRHSKGDDLETISWIPGKGYGTLPFSDVTHNPNLVRIFIDVQHDFLHDRVYLLGALVTGNERGKTNPKRRRSVVRLADAAPDSHETEGTFLRDWIADVLVALGEVAAPDAEGQPQAPIHLVFFHRFAQQQLLDALARHATTVLGTTALYDFVTQIAAFDSPLVTILEQQIQESRNYPMVCQSLQSVAQYNGFDWSEFRRPFRQQVFDYIGNLAEPGSEPDWITRRARFNSQIPLEYAYAAWDDLPDPEPGKADEFEGFRKITGDQLTAFHARRLEAIEHIANQFKGNRQSELTPYDLSVIASMDGRATTMAHAIAEFVTIERHAELSEWRSARYAEPEQRQLAGNALVVRYVEADQTEGVAERNRKNFEARDNDARFISALKAQNPKATRRQYTAEQKAAAAWSQDDIVFRLRIETDSSQADLHDILARSTFKDGARLVIMPRLASDSRLPEAERREFTPTPRQIPWGLRADLKRIEVERKDGRVVRAWAHVMLSGRGGGGEPKGYVFATLDDYKRPLTPGGLYSLDDDPNSWTGFWGAQIAEALVAGSDNTVYRILANESRPAPAWPPSFEEGQRRFLAGLDALREAGILHDFEVSKREFIGEHTNTGVLLVQGPPGTGKSYSTAFALLARFQGAMQAGLPYRIGLSCKTHAATNVLIENLANVQAKLAGISREHPDLFDAWFDRRILSVPLYRYRQRFDRPGVIYLPKDDDQEKGAPKAWPTLENQIWCVVAGTPGAFRGLVVDQFKTKNMFGHTLIHCLVLDEASQMNLPEAILAGLSLAPDGNLIVVGDHRQMPPIVKNDWSNERRRTFSEFRTYESVFLTLLQNLHPRISFEESFRLHAVMAEFLRREIYVHDGINYHSNRHKEIAPPTINDSFVRAVLDPQRPLVVVMHEETNSQQANAYEQELMAPVLSELASPDGLKLDPYEGLGVVVPHRAQRSALIDNIRDVSIRDDDDEIVVSSVDTVERFQGRERSVMLFGATESDADYLRVAGDFLLDPRRLNVALSRAKEKMVLVASRSVFEVFSADEETFANAQLWKNLLRHTCTEKLWEGARHGHQVTVWGNEKKIESRK